MSIRDSFLVRGGSLCLLPTLSTGSLNGLNLGRPCSCCHSLCGFISLSLLLCLETLFPWEHPSLPTVTIFLLLFPCSSLNPEGRSSRKAYQSLSLSPHYLDVGRCISSHLLQVEAALMMDE